MLFIDNGKRQCLECHIVLDQRVGADQEIDLAALKPCQDVATFPAFFASGEDRDPQAGTFGERRDGFDVLAREDFRWRHQRGLFADFGHGSYRSLQRRRRIQLDSHHQPKHGQ